jgi:hypothetical protein
VCLRVTLEMPGRDRNGGGTYIGWPQATGDDLVSGILLFDHKARRKGLGSREKRLRWGLNEMLRRYRAAGGTGPERLGVTLARTPFGKVRSAEAEAPSAGPPVLELTAEAAE